MNRFIPLCFLLLFASNVFAQDTHGPVIRVQPLNDAFKAEKMAGPNVVVESRRKPAQAETQGDSPIPSLKEEEKMFLDAGLSKADLDGWDSLAKDTLFLRARDFTLSELVESYPTFEKTKLKKLMEIIHLWQKG